MSLRTAGALLLILAVATTAAAQGGRGGKGRHRSPEPPAPAREQATDEFPLDGSQVLEAIDRGESVAALAYYERAAAQAEQQGDALRAARAWHAASMVLVTGLGKLSRGDELVGLQRAFLYAGTPAVVTTLWKVDDRAPFELVRAFYDRLAAAGLVEALRQAQIEALRAFPHPFAWAAFEVTAP